MAHLRPYQYYDSTISLCSTCLRRVDAKIVFQQGSVWMLKRCPHHGSEKVLLADDIEYYKSCRETYIKPPEQVSRYNTKANWGCPYDCGICPDHEQHGCTLLLEITDSCNLRCPTCFANSCPDKSNHLPLETINAMLDRAVSNETTPAIVQISGGEPTIHPEFWEIMDAAKSRPIEHLLINTNGIEIAKDPDFAKRLKQYCPGFEVYLQFDSLKAESIKQLRGADLTKIHRDALLALNQYNIPTTLVCTVRRGINDEQLGEVIEFAQTQKCVRGVTFQPLQAAGRLSNDNQPFDPNANRITLTEVRRKILQQSDLFEPQDIIPVPCNADSLAMGYALRVKQQREKQEGNSVNEDEFIPLTQLIDPKVLINQAGNTIAYETDPQIRKQINHLFSTHHSPQSQLLTLKQLIKTMARKSMDELVYDNVFRVLIVDFMDAYNFDLRSIRKSCVHILHPDGKRAIPFETYNMLYRDQLEQEVLMPLRAEREGRQISGPISATDMIDVTKI